MKNIFAIISISLLFLGSSFAQVGDEFPKMSGTSLTDKEISIPADTQDKFTLVGLAYSKKAEDDLKTWFQPVWERFIRAEDPNALIPEMKPDVHVVFVPMFTGIKRGASNAAIKKMQKDVDKKLHAHVMVYSGKLGDYEEALNFEQKDTPYFFVIDKSGKIVYATSGKVSPQKLNEVEKLVGAY